METKGECRIRRCMKSVKATLVFRREELLYDVESYSYVEGDVMKTDDDHARHQVFDVAQGGNENLVTRMLNLAHAECVEVLYPFTKKECSGGEVFDNSLVEHEEYTIELTLPPEFSHTTLLLLKELIHKYFVVRVLAEWMGMTNPGSTANWQARLEETKEKMKNTLTWRTKRLRIRQHPF